MRFLGHRGLFEEISSGVNYFEAVWEYWPSTNNEWLYSLVGSSYVVSVTWVVMTWE